MTQKHGWMMLDVGYPHFGDHVRISITISPKRTTIPGRGEWPRALALLRNMQASTVAWKEISCSFLFRS